MSCCSTNRLRGWDQKNACTSWRYLNRFARAAAWSSSSTTWMPCSSWRSESLYFMKAANWRKAHPTRFGSIRQSRQHISEGWTSMSLLEVENINSYYGRSEEHTSELQSLMRTTYAVFCFKKNHNIKS